MEKGRRVGERIKMPTDPKGELAKMDADDEIARQALAYVSEFGHGVKTPADFAAFERGALAYRARMNDPNVYDFYVGEAVALIGLDVNAGYPRP